MTLTVGDTTFDNVFYDADADVLYLHVGDPLVATDFDETPEGHAIRFGPNREVVGLTLVGPRALLESEGRVEITMPTARSLEFRELAEVLS